VPGNAALFYHRGIEDILQIRANLALRDRSEGRDRPSQPEVDISDWIAGPLDQIPVDEARAQLDTYRDALREVELGVLRRECDWEFDDRSETINLRIHEIQESRSLARLVSLRVRLAIL